MARRSKGEGSIFKRADGRWVGQLTVADSTGRRQRRSFYGKTQKEARERLVSSQRQLDQSGMVPSDRMTVGTYLARWLSTKQHGMRTEGFRRYREIVELHLIPQLGRRRPTRLTALDIEEAYAALREKGLSGTSMAGVHGVLRKALRDARRSGLVDRVATEGADAPKRDTPMMTSLTSEEARRLLAAAQGDELEAFYVVALTTGARLGELQALTWDAVELDRRRLRVLRTYQGNVDGEPIFAPPKTPSSVRAIHLSEMAVSALRRHRARQAEQRLRVGDRWHDLNLVFAGSFGRPLDGTNIRVRSFAALLERAGLPPMRLHGLRHAAASLLLAEGTPVKAVSEMLGHAKVVTTLQIYAHVLPTTQEQAAGTMDRLFGGGGDRQAVR